MRTWNYIQEAVLWPVRRGLPCWSHRCDRVVLADPSDIRWRLFHWRRTPRWRRFLWPDSRWSDRRRPESAAQEMPLSAASLKGPYTLERRFSRVEAIRESVCSSQLTAHQPINAKKRVVTTIKRQAEAYALWTVTLLYKALGEIVLCTFACLCN